MHLRRSGLRDDATSTSETSHQRASWHSWQLSSFLSKAPTGFDRYALLLSLCHEPSEQQPAASMARTPPPLPPRNPSVSSLSSVDSAPIASPRYRSDTGHHLAPYPNSRKSSLQNYPYSGGFDDPRNSSTQSLRPVESAGANRRTLLIVYIHGFLGNETSFRSFPAHVHNVLTTTLAETHVVYSKIYPRYKSRKNISFARDDFSKWLAPLESPSTDVILVGHSLGGILAAEVALMPADMGDYQNKHRLLGIIAVDVPFLGMHPGVVGTGIASLFRSNPEQSEESEPTPSTSSATSPTSPFSDMSSDPADPNFNPAFANDVRMADRKGKLNRAWYFWNKHWGELGKATQSYVTSHLEFGGCLADYPGLRRRYDAARALEDIDEYSHPRSATGRFLRRVRFVNYYSASTGRVKERMVTGIADLDPMAETTQGTQNMSLHPVDSSTTNPTSTRTPSPRISLEEHRDGHIVSKTLEDETNEAQEDQHSETAMTAVDPRPVSPSYEQERHPSPDIEQEQPASPDVSRTTAAENEELPPLPPVPISPAEFDASRYTNPDALKLAQKEHTQQVKAFERAKKDRDKTIRDREKLVQKREKAALKEQQKREKEQLKRSATLNPDEYDKQLQSASSASKVNPSVAPKKQKDRKFCTLPSKDPRTGKRDPTWVRVYMEGIDEVVAHTSMFKMSETYAKLVGDTVARIEDWIGEDATRKAVMHGDEQVDFGYDRKA